MNTLQKQIHTLTTAAKEAGYILAAEPAEQINHALEAMAKALDTHRKEIQDENKKDLAAGKKRGLSAAMIDRLTLSDTVIDSMISGVETIKNLPTPIGQRYEEKNLENGLRLSKMKVPIGVVGIIYESRPNVTVDAAAICLKSNNAVILRGGSEAFYSNTILARIFSDVLRDTGLPEKAVQLIDTTDRQAVNYLLKESSTVDLIIPRGGEKLIETVVEHSHIPVIKHYKGVCHLYIAPSASPETARAIAINGKTQRPGVCNALETILIHRDVPEAVKKDIISALIQEGVCIRGDAAIQTLSDDVEPAGEEDWDREYLDLIVTMGEVSSTDAAIAHINRHGSGHTEAIVTADTDEMAAFQLRVDASSVMVNASTRFADGGEYGMGCEIGISTDKLHARGPMGVDDLTTYKWLVEGEGQVRE
ncbi:glutamate-5-semialdehyde dehydrogenase [Chitinivibrio alkaliphilus]|uniref:Gamma-glutamyl phosphate reductase n=1 Tax=Chitinivibrio alkaliphilus ACht1 TaxID=1313304 RepID=U7DA05_9BACT|nr:glutamate-5-semialdehyde dehydrogenase [Chitinivibrio alkaliphilus]ERP39239.1 gamma-glutamyl phosphate reductase [Chitinivibrio alkaliphilus ACht1]